MIELIKRLTRLASDLDNKGLTKEADILDKAAIKIAAGCGEAVGDELYYLENLFDMHEDIEHEEHEEHEEDPHDLVDT
jgi:hypothetical protein